MEVVASLSQGRTAAAQCGLFTHRSVPVIFEPPCTITLPVVSHRHEMCFYYEGRKIKCKIWKQKKPGVQLTYHEVHGEFKK